MRQRFRWSVGAELAVVSSAVFGGVSTFAVRMPPVIEQVTLADAACGVCIADILGGTGDPTPSQGDVQLALSYLVPNGSQGYTPQTVFTPEGLYPASGVKSLPLDTSVQQGVSILNSTLDGQIQGGNHVVVYGVSQSAVIASLEMDKLAGLAALGGTAPAADQLSFVLLGDEMNPNGGLLERFAVPGVPASIPSMGIDFYGATPLDTVYPTTIYTAEYDGFADFPRYPINVVADANALLGIAFVHGAGYSRADAIASAQLLPGSTHYVGPEALPVGSAAALDTDYYMIPTPVLPLLQPLLSIPLIGKPLYDLLEPDTKILVDLGYGNVDTYAGGVLTDGGWDQGPADVPTPFGLFPQHLDLGALLNSLLLGAQHGVTAFIGDVTGTSSPAADAAETVAMAGGAAQDFSLPSLTEIVNALSSAASSLYSVLLPTADIVTALVTTLPLYDASLFFAAFQDGHDLLTDLVNAVGMPIAADFGLGGMAAGFELATVLSAVEAAVNDITGLF